MRSRLLCPSLFAFLSAAAANAQEPAPSAPSAPSPPAAVFGHSDTTVITGAFGLGMSAGVYDDPNVFSTSISISPGLDKFVLENVSIGAGVDIDWSRSQGYGTHGAIDRRTSTSGGLNVRWGYNFPIGNYVSWWPRLYLGYSLTNNTVESSETPTGYQGDRSPDLGGTYWKYNEHGAYIFAYAPILVHPTPHLFFGIGPGLYRDLGRAHENSFPADNDRTTLSLYFTTGVWF
jgi:hypothetical protein